MSKINSEKNIIIQLLKSEYDLARHEWEYYTDLFNKQDNLYSIYFAIFAIIIGAIYYIIHVNNENTLFDNITLLHNQKTIICGLIVFLAITYMYFVLEKTLNYFLDKKVFVWETNFMSTIQSKDNVFTKGYLNVNILKMVFAIALYCTVEVPLCILWYFIIGYEIPFFVYIAIVTGVSLFLMYNWIIIWWRLPKYYRKELKKLYKNKLNIHI